MCSIFQRLGRQKPLQHVVVSGAGTKAANKGGFLSLRGWDRARGSPDSAGGQPGTRLPPLLAEVRAQGQTPSVVPAPCSVRKPGRNCGSPRSPSSAGHPGPTHPKHTSTPRDKELLPRQARKICLGLLCGRRRGYGLLVTHYPKQIKDIPSTAPRAAECIQSSRRAREEERARTLRAAARTQTHTCHRRWQRPRCPGSSPGSGASWGWAKPAAGGAVGSRCCQPFLGPGKLGKGKGFRLPQCLESWAAPWTLTPRDPSLRLWERLDSAPSLLLAPRGLGRGRG